MVVACLVAGWDEDFQEWQLAREETITALSEQCRRYNQKEKQTNDTCASREAIVCVVVTKYQTSINIKSEVGY